MSIKLFADKAGVLKTIDDIQALFGPNGEHWAKGHYKDELAPKYDEATNEVQHLYSFCLSGAIREVDGPYEVAAYAAITEAVREANGKAVRPNDEDVLAYLFENDDEFDDDDLEAALSSYLPGGMTRIDGDLLIVRFNDVQERTWPQIVELLDNARRIVRDREYEPVTV